MNITSTVKSNRNFAETTSPVVDTTFVLFFMALELGRSFNRVSLDSFMLLATMLVVMFVPYVLLPGERPDFRKWALGRAAIAAYAFVAGIFFSFSLGTVLPEIFRFMPMTLLIASAVACCFIQFYSFLNMRYIK
jgi:hypothetical protein